MKLRDRQPCHFRGRGAALCGETCETSGAWLGVLCTTEREHVTCSACRRILKHLPLSSADLFELFNRSPEGFAQLQRRIAETERAVRRSRVEMRIVNALILVYVILGAAALFWAPPIGAAVFWAPSIIAGLSAGAAALVFWWRRRGRATP